MRSSKTREADVFVFKLIGYPILFLFVLLCLLPFLLVISSSFTSETAIIKYGYGLWPREFSLASYHSIFSNFSRVIRAYGVTILVTSTGTVLSILLNTMTGYVLQRRDFSWRNKFSFYFFFTTLFSGGLMPWYILCVRYLGLKDSLLALILPGLISVWNILLVKGYMASLPFEILESGKIDGAGDFTIYARLVMPICTPVIATIGLFTALAFWNDWYNSMLFINDENKFSLQYLLYKLINDAKMMRMIAAESGDYIETGPIESMKMALTLIVTGPILLLYPFVQRYFVKGLTLGAVKG